MISNVIQFKETLRKKMLCENNHVFPFILDFIKFIFLARMYNSKNIGLGQ